jgi:hypothetical protein
MKEKKDLVNEWELRYCGCSLVSFGLEIWDAKYCITHRNRVDDGLMDY